MKTKFTLAGIYGPANLQWLESIGYNSFELDLRPRSFQFLPHYQAHEIISGAGVASKFQVHFQNENSLLIEKFIDDSASSEVNYLFSATLDLELIERKDVKFSLLIDTENEHLLDDSKVRNHKNLKSVIFNYNYLHHKLMNNQIVDVLKKVQELETKIGIRLNFADDIAPSLWELFHADEVVLDLDGKVECGYRQFSKELFQSEFSKLTQMHPELAI